MKFCGNLPGQIQNIDVCLENAAFFPKGCDNRVNFQDMFWKDNGFTLINISVEKIGHSGSVFKKVVGKNIWFLHNTSFSNGNKESIEKPEHFVLILYKRTARPAIRISIFAYDVVCCKSGIYGQNCRVMQGNPARMFSL